MCNYTPYKERQIDEKINKLFELYNQCITHINQKTSAIDTSLEKVEENVEKLAENFDVVLSIETRLTKVEESLENINRFIQNMGYTLPRQFLQTYILCKEETLAIIEDKEKIIMKAIKKESNNILSITNTTSQKFHKCIVTPESFQEVMDGKIEKNIKIVKDLPITIDNCRFICPNWQFNILTDKGASYCDPIGLTFYEFTFNFTKCHNSKYVYDNLVIDKDYLKKCLSLEYELKNNTLLQFTQFYQLILFSEYAFINEIVDSFEQLMSFLRHICSTYIVYRIEDKIITIRYKPHMG